MIYEYPDWLSDDGIITDGILETLESAKRNEDFDMGYWVTDTLTLIHIKGLKDEGGHPLWRDDGSEFGQLMFKPVVVDDKKYRGGLIFVVFFVEEHQDHHSYLYDTLVELVDDFLYCTGLTRRDSIEKLITWAHEQRTSPQRGKLNHHFPYPRLTK